MHKQIQELRNGTLFPQVYRAAAPPVASKKFAFHVFFLIAASLPVGHEQPPGPGDPPIMMCHATTASESH